MFYLAEKKLHYHVFNAYFTFVRRIKRLSQEDTFRMPWTDVKAFVARIHYVTMLWIIKRGFRIDTRRLVA